MESTLGPGVGAGGVRASGMEACRCHLLYSRLQKVGIWIEGDLCWCSFFLLFLNQGAVTFQLSGFYCTVGASKIDNLMVSHLEAHGTQYLFIAGL